MGYTAKFRCGPARSAPQVLLDAGIRYRHAGELHRDLADLKQDDTYHEAIYRFVSIMLKAYIANPGMKFAVFIHKAEMLSEDYRGGESAALRVC